MSSLWLNKKKKSELVALCDQLGIEADGCLKSDLENMLTEYLRANETELSSDQTFSPYYDTITTRSPSKATKLEEVHQTRSRRRTGRHVAGSGSFDNGSTDVESTPEPQTERKTRSGSRAMANRTPRTLRSLREAAVSLPPSPAVVADEIERGTNAIIASAKKVVEKAEIQGKATGLRDRLSNVTSVNAITLSLEFIMLLVAIIPVTYPLTIPAIAAQALGTPRMICIIPDLFVLLTAAFWAPFLTWLATALVLPIGNALLFNIVSTTVRNDGSMPADPVTYAVTRALLTYIVHYKGFSFWGLLGDKAVATVGSSVGRELQLVGAGIGGIAALWDGILRTR